MIPKALILVGDEAFWRDVFAKAKGADRRQCYYDYMQSTVWQRHRAATMKRANNVCEKCTLATAVNAHHQTYARLGDERPEDLLALCRECHKAEHGKALKFWESLTHNSQEKPA